MERMDNIHFTISQLYHIKITGNHVSRSKMKLKHKWSTEYLSHGLLKLSLRLNLISIYSNSVFVN